jgi:predicted metal-dependent enzyme (double-stranded beta helix superfamily)
MMQGMLRGNHRFLKPEHLRADPDRYARNAIHIDDDGNLSLFALVWNPGQWTPVHDHGTWGVVGVVTGVLEERNLIRVSPDDGRDRGIALAEGGVILMSEGTVTTFVPNPDHIHMTGVPSERAQAVSLHLYGRALTSFHVYDVAVGTRRLIDVPHYKS